jgi:hypothetical protein
MYSNEKYRVRFMATGRQAWVTDIYPNPMEQQTSKITKYPRHPFALCSWKTSIYIDQFGSDNYSNTLN